MNHVARNSRSGLKTRAKEIFVLIFAFVALSTLSLSAQNTPLSLSLKNATLEEAINAIEKQSDFRFIYNKTQVNTSQRKTLNLNNQPIGEVLKKLLGNTDIGYRIEGRQIVLSSKTAAVRVGESKKISGVVTDEQGEPVIGANVSVKGTNTGTITDLDGKFELTAGSGQTVEVSYIGFQKADIAVGSQTSLKITLHENALNLNEVVVTALGIKREEKALGYAVQKVSGDAVQKVSGVDVATSLTGKVSGLLVKNSSDFAVAPAMTIRGEAPLLVIDGVAYANKTLSDIASQDIESMSVLKGATASALYGYRGASGAILITTKNGSSNNKGITVDLSTNTMFTAGFLAIPERQSLYGRGSNNTYDKNSTSSWGTLMDGTVRNQWDPRKMEYRDYPYLPIGANNFKNFLEQGFVTNNNINIAHKSEFASLRSSFNFTQNKGQYPNQVLNKFTYTFGGDISLEKFKLSSNLSYSKRESPNMGSNGYTSYDPMYSLLIWSGSDFNILDYKNNYWLEKDKVQNYTYRNESNNPYFDAYEKTNQVSRDIFNADLTASYDLTPWLKATLRSGLDFFVDKGTQRVSMGSYVSSGNTPVPGNQWTWNGAWTGAFTTGQTQGFSMNNDLLLTGNRSIGKLDIDYLAGGTIYYKRDNTMYAATSGGLSVPGFFSLRASVNPVDARSMTYAQQVNSIYGRVSLSWDKLVYLEATGRNDWSSTLRSDNRSYFYPSVASSFVISELLPDTKDFLDLLKVRASWTLSKTPPGIYATNIAYAVNSATWGTMNGATAPDLIYGNVLPESSRTYEVGAQAHLFKNRLMVDLSYYDKLMYDFLKQAPISPATGYTKKYVNTLEQIARRGVELTVNGTPVKTRDWQLDLTLNWSTFGRYYAQLDENYSSNKPWVKVGERVDALVSRDLMRDPKGSLIYNNGRLQYSQYDSNFGWTDPDWLWGLNATLRYKNFSLYASFDGVVGGLMNTRTESYMWQSGIHPASTTPERGLDVANPGSSNYLGNGVKVTSGTATYDMHGNITSDTRQYAPNDVKTTYKQYAIDLHNSSAWGGAGSPADTYSKTFFKFRELSVTYDIPKVFLQKIKLKQASVSFVGQNILLWAKDFKYSDPDGGVEDFSDPAVRYLGANIKITL